MSRALAASSLAVLILLASCSSPDAPTAVPARPAGSAAVAAPAASEGTTATEKETGRPARGAGQRVAPTPKSTTTPSPASTLPRIAPKDALVTKTDPASGLFTVNGVPLINKQHRLKPSYVPPWASKPLGLKPEAYQALNALMAGAKADGLRLVPRSGYRSYAVQAGSLARALKKYPAATARAYYAEPGASEHQAGLAVDMWDGRNRGTAFTRLPQARWLAAHAHEYGFIVRYPQSKTGVTGYAAESWHLRYVGKDIAQQFGPNSILTLEEFLHQA